MKPKPNAAPIMPNFAARLSGGVTSVMYAPAVALVAAETPDSSRPMNSHHSDGASAITT